MNVILHRKGQMLLEVVIAMGVLVLFVTAFVSFILGAYDGGRKAKERTEAAYIAQQGIESVRSISHRDFDLLTVGNFGVFEENNTYVLTGALTIHGNFERVISIQTVKRNDKADIVWIGGDEDISTKEVKSTVSWKGKSFTLTTLFTDWTRPRWSFDLLAKAGSGFIHATEPLPGTGGIVFKGNGDLSVPQVRFTQPVSDGTVIRDLQVEPDADRLYVLSQINDIGPEFIAYDLSNVSNNDMPALDGVELGTDGVKFILGEEYAYVLTAHGDRDIMKIHIGGMVTESMWDIKGAAKPIDMAIDENTNRAFVITNRAEQGKSLSALPPEIVTTGLFVDTAYAQGIPTCNGQSATVYVSGGNIVGGPNAGDAYTAGVTVLLGNDDKNNGDVIVGTSAGDIITGQKGADIICGGDGADTISGGDEIDIICGEGGNDTITGGKKVDKLDGGDGTDSIDGETNGATCANGESTSSCTAGTVTECEPPDTTNPSVDSVSPADNGTDIDPTSNLVITFDEAVTEISGDITIYESDGTLVEAIDVTGGLVSGDGTTTITVSPTSDLGNAVSYYVYIDSTAFDDASGNSYAGIGDSATWNFTTVANCTPDPLPTCNGLTATVYVNNCNIMVGGTDDGNAYDGTINGSANVDDVIVGTSGDDTIDAKSGDDTICGGDGVDDITAGAGLDVVLGEGGNDIITGEGGDDVICGGDGDDNITGAGGDDQLDGGPGTDDLNGTGQTDICRNGETYTNCEDTWSAISVCGVAADTTAPTIDTLSPLDDAGGVSASVNLVITFDEVVNTETGNITIYDASDDSIVEAIDVTSGLVTGDGTTTITINPTSDLPSGGSYYIQIDATAIDDYAGNSYAGIADSTTWNFTVADTGAPTASTLSPVDDATGVGVSADLVITFDEIVNTETGDIRIYTASNNTLVETIDVTSGLVTGDGTTSITIDPSTILTTGTEYYVQVDATAFDDVSSNSFAGISGTTAWSFTTSGSPPDTVDPTVDTLSPVDGATEISTTSNLVLTFDEEVIPVSGNIVIYDASDDSIVETIDVTSGLVTGSGTIEITVNPASALDINTSYYIQVDETAFDDLSGNSYAGIADTTSWNFTTTSVAPDTTDPTADSVSPADDSTNIATTTNLVLTFDEIVFPVSGNITIYDASDDSVIEVIDVTSGLVTGSGSTTIIIDPTADLVAGTSYYIHVDATAFDDAAGNSYAGISDTTSWNFSTGTEPSVSSFSPADDAEDIVLTTNLIITFDEEVMPVSGNITIYDSSDDSIVETIGVTSAQVTGSGTTTITIDPSTTLLAGFEYYVLIDADGFDDLSGESYAGISDSTVWSFITDAEPSVASYSPTDDTTGVDGSTNLILTFNEAVNVESGNITIYNASGDSVVEVIDVTSGQVSGDGGTTITINPSATLIADNMYYIQIDATAFDDLAGNSYAGISDTTTWNFTTGDGPSITGFSPEDNAAGIGTDPTLTITFDEEVTLVTGNITIYSSDGTVLEVIDITSAQVTGSGTTTITIDPSITFEDGGEYYILVDSTAIDGVSGEGFAGIASSTTWNFGVGVVSERTARARRPKPTEKLYVIDVSSEGTTELQDASILKEVVIPTAKRIEIVGTYAFLLTDNSAAELAIMNLNTYEITHCDLPGGQSPNDMVIDGSTLYVSKDSGALEEFVSFGINTADPSDCEYIQKHPLLAIEIGDDTRAFTILSEEGLAFALAGYGLSNFQVINMEEETVKGLKPFSNVDGLCEISHTVGSYIFTGCRGDGSVTVFEGQEGVSEYFLWGTYTSPAFDAGEYASQIRSIQWQTGGEGEVFLRVRTAATEKALQSATWVGPDGTSATFYDDSDGQDFSLKNIGGGPFVQWKAYFRKIEDQTPILKNVILSFE
jgi:methionine-rich copper-binding protein CopC/Ca2+-binding RTX toxin-like protein